MRGKGSLRIPVFLNYWFLRGNFDKRMSVKELWFSKTLEKGLSYNQLSIIISYSLQISAFNKVFQVILVFGVFAIMSLK